MGNNRLYFGDCLDVLREDVPDESVDLIYLDPPFNSKRLYNAYIGGAQWVAFEDTWRWHEAVDDFHAVAGDVDLGRTLEGLRQILGEGPNLAYLSYMANRLREFRRVLKPTGSIYLHCDPTMSHYLKVVMDGLFGDNRFRNELAWCYRKWGVAAGQFVRNHDVILMYTKSQKSTFNVQYVPVSDGTIKRWKGRKQQAVFVDGDRTATSTDKESQSACPDWWDISIINPNAKERMGYPTQKPLALLDRIVRASSNPGDVVLDPFCGCGTTIHAAQLLGRQWIGVDVCVNACKVIERRMRDNLLWSQDVEFVGMPTTADDAHVLADMDKFRFERWAAALVDGMEPNRKQRGDHGIDGWGRLPIRKGVFLDVVSQVKGGSTGPGHVQAFNGARQQASADLGIFTCFGDRVTSAMRDAAASAGRFMEVPRVQIYTIEDYFEDRKPLMPKAA